MLPQEIIRTKRDGLELSSQQIRDFIGGLTDGRVTEGQAAAFAMAVLFRGMNIGERVALTDAMTRSGSVLSWDLPGPVIDKHSTGGIGDKVSLMLAPILAACGAYVPMIAGRGLGHTGGTIDKLDAVPGYVTQPDSEWMSHVVREVGCAIVGATPDVAPADRRMYAIRDVTATVESIDLITASILSKKCAAGLQALVMDVKFGSGAFMVALDDARALARSIVQVANQAGLNTTALLTDMNQVLGRTAGNAIEILEAIEFLRQPANADPRLRAVTVSLCAEALALGGLYPDIGAATKAVGLVLANGAAAERFQKMIAALGGPADLVDQPLKYLPQPAVKLAVRPLRSGYVQSIDVRAIGLAIVELGGGRKRAQDSIDHSVGLEAVAAVGMQVSDHDHGAVLSVIGARDEAAAARAALQLQAAFVIGDTPPAETPLIAERIAA